MGSGEDVASVDVGSGLTVVGDGVDVVGPDVVTSVEGCDDVTSDVFGVTGGTTGPGPVGVGLTFVGPPDGTGELGSGAGFVAVGKGSVCPPSSEEQALAISMAAIVAV